MSRLKGNIKHKNKHKQVVPDKFGALQKWMLAIVLLAGLLVYANAFDNDFVLNWDDDGYIINNTKVHALTNENIKAIFTSFHMGNYHPLTTLSYAIEYSFFGANAKAFHTTNIFLHLINIFLVFAFIKALTKNYYVAVFTALIFGIHPMQVESVAWISERKDVLYTFFFLFSALLFVKFLDKKKPSFYLFSLLLFLLSLLSKSAAVSLPLILLLVIFFKEESKVFSVKKYLKLAPFFVLSLLFGIIALKSQDASGQQLTPDYTALQTFFVAHYAFFFYLYKFLCPFQLSAFHPHPELINNTVPLLYYLASVLVWGIITALYFWLKDKKVFIFGFLLFVFSILPVVQIIPVGGAVVAERYTYVPYIGLAFIMAFLAEKYITLKRTALPVKVFLTVFVLLCLMQTHNRNKVWANGLTLFEDVVEKYPESFYAYHSRGVAWHYANNLHKALTDYNKAIVLNDVYGYTYYNRGLIYNMMQQYEAAEQDFSKAIELMPDDNNSYTDRAVSRLNMKDYAGAIKDFDKAITQNPDNARALYNRGVAHLQTGKTSKACEDFSKAAKNGLTQANDLLRKYCE